jgi:hypothetical protein
VIVVVLRQSSLPCHSGDAADFSAAFLAFFPRLPKEKSRDRMRKAPLAKIR